MTAGRAVAADPDELGQWDDRPADVRSLSAAAGYDYHDSKIGMRIHELSPGERSALSYHYHDEQVEVFYVLKGALHVETPDAEHVVGADQALFVEPGSPQRAYNPADADVSVRVLVVGALSVEDGHADDPDDGT